MRDDDDTALTEEVRPTEKEIEHRGICYRLIALWRLAGDSRMPLLEAAGKLGAKWVRWPDGRLEPRLPEPLQIRMNEIVSEQTLMDSIDQALWATHNGPLEAVYASVQENGFEDQAGDDILAVNARIIAARGFADFVYEARKKFYRQLNENPEMRKIFEEDFA